MARLIEKNKDDIISILCGIETVKTAILEVEKTINALRTYYKEDVYLTKRKPLGRVAVFLPFNMPLYSLVLYAFGPAYVGNTVLVRPSKITKNALFQVVGYFSSQLEELGIFLLETSGKDFLNDILNANKVDVIIFTGKYESVLDIKEKCCEVKLIYCGSGVCPVIVREDANLKAAVSDILYSKFFNSGQDCLATETVYVNRTIDNEFTTELLSQIKNIRVGLNTSIESDIGELMTLEQVQRAIELIEQYSDSSIIIRGTVEGRYMEPVVIQTVMDDANLHTEKFAPVLMVAPYSDESKMIEIINNSDNLLAMSVYGSRYPDNTFLMDHVEYNRSVIAAENEDAHIPFGGYRQSGFVAESGRIIKEGPILFSVETSTQ